VAVPAGAPVPAPAVPAPVTAAPAATPAPAAAAAAPPAPAPPPAPEPPPSFGSDPFGATAAALDLQLKLYGDTAFAVRDAANQPWQTGTSNPNVYANGINASFAAPRLDLFGTASIDKLNFVSEIMFDAYNNSIGVDIERMQLSYLVGDWLRITAGRKHMAWGYYNDTFHHGNIFELTTGRPYSVNFEDSFGLVMSHLVGVSVDGTFKVGDGQVRYDLEIGNSRSKDVTAVPLEYAEGSQPTVNARLRWMPVDGLIVGVNGMRDVIPAFASGASGVASRPEVEELVAGAHVVYTEHHVLLDAEAFAMQHTPNGASAKSIYGGFAELGYTIKALTPYVRGEYIRFPSGGDPAFQYSTADAQGALLSANSVYLGVQDFADLRIGLKWLVMPQLALKLEGDRIGRDGTHQEIATVKAAFGF
jgi:hypothetical protein